MPNQRAEGVRRRTVALPDALWSAARQRAAERGESVGAVIRRCLENYVKEQA